MWIGFVLRQVASYRKHDFAYSWSLQTMHLVFTYLLTPLSKVLLEKVTDSQQAKKSPHFVELTFLPQCE